MTAWCFCWSPVSDDLQHILDADPQLREKRETVPVLHNRLLLDALCWGSNRQSAVEAYQGHPCSTLETSGRCGIVSGYDMAAMVEVHLTDCGWQQSARGALLDRMAESDRTAL